MATLLHPDGKPPRGGFAAQIRARIASRLASRNGKALILSFLAAIVSRFGQVALAVILARHIGPAGYGTFTFAMGIAMIGGQFGTLGWATLNNRLMPGFIKNGEWDLLKGMVRGGDMVVLGVTVSAALLLYFAAPWLGHLADGVQLSAIMLPLLAFAIMRRQQLAAVRRAAIGLLFDQGFASVLLAGAILIAGALSVEQAIYGFSLFSMLGIAITTILFWRLLPREMHGARPTYRIGHWTALALPMIIGVSARLIMNRIDVLMLAPLSDMEQVGLYGAAFRVTYLMSFPQVVLMTVMTPLFSEAFTHGKYGKARRLMRLANIYGLVTTLPIIAAILFFPSEIMELVFGEKFTAGGPVLSILAFSQLAGSLAIPSASVMMMGGREKLFGGWNLSALILDVILCAALIPFYGAVGAAVASAIASFYLFVGQYYFSRSLLRKSGD